jgi:hypothetical protein
MFAKFTIAILFFALLCNANPLLRPLYKGAYDASAQSVPMGTSVRVEKIISNFRKHMEVQFAKRQLTLECGLFDLFFIPPTPSEEFQTAACFALREVLSAKLDASEYTNQALVSAQFAPLSPGLLGSAGPRALCQRDGTGLYFPASLLQLEGANSSCDPNTLPSIEMNFNSEINWYFGLDGDVPQAQFDFVTVVSHELTHGLGFLSAVSLTDSETASYTYDALYFVDSTYDPPLNNNSNAELYDWAIESKVFTYTDFDDTINSYPNQGVFSPDPAQPGSSLSHFIFDINEESPPTCHDLNFDLCNSLMRNQLSNGLSIHRMGGNVMNMLSNMGYQFFDCTAVTDKATCLGTDTEVDPRCDWCNSDDFCTDITLVDYVWVNSCAGNDYEFDEKSNIEEDAASSLTSVF